MTTKVRGEEVHETMLDVLEALKATRLIAKYKPEFDVRILAQENYALVRSKMFSRS